MSDTNDQSRTFLSETKWQPRNNMMLLKPTVEPERAEGSSIIRPDSYRKKMSSGFICKKGPDVDPHLWLGDEVFFEPHQEYRLILDDINEEAVLVSDSHILLSMRPEPVKSDVTSQAVLPHGIGQKINIAKFYDVDLGRIPNETDTEYNARIGKLAPSGYYWNALTGDFELNPDDRDEPVSRNRVHHPRNEGETDAAYNQRMLGHEDKWWFWSSSLQQFVRREK